eukprot:TRINITY_DN428_c0_g1_i5.p1 TRINITY_DN428_c0_g1~~TRINITY_DN428_c0_g1_i5.p1  ORF type:complete len:385 (-),score=77.65 TRINITY_DN428_c0_g1_i5:588-1742(-)
MTELRKSKSSTIRDVCPDLPSAGKLVSRPDENTATCMHYIEPPPTPDHMRKFRLSGTGAPGITVKHPGRANDPPPLPESKAYGDRVVYTYGVNSIANPPPVSNFVQAVHDQKESVYLSRKSGPLGRSLSRNYSFPEQVFEPSFSFGHSPEISLPAKEVIYPVPADENEQTKELYKKSHRDFEAGEQKTRAYDWESARVDPTRFQFGYKQEIEQEGVKKSLLWNGGDAATGKPQAIVNTAVDRRDQYVHSSLGKVRKSHAAKDQHDPNHVFGLESLGRNFTAGEVISGNYSKEEQQPEPDLGTYRRGISPSTVKALNVSRAYGTPSIRSDLRLPPIKSVTNYTNYGNELPIKGLLYPNRFSDQGITEVELQMPLPYEEVCFHDIH